MTRAPEPGADRGMKLSMVMIARDEAHVIRRCLESFWDHVDEVVLCDTGSADGTIGEARRFARERGEPDKLVVGRFRWCDDFGAARTYAHSLATGGVHSYVDADDLIIGAEHLRAEAARLADDPNLVAISAPYEWTCNANAEPLEVADWQRRPWARLFRPPVIWERCTWEIVESVRCALEIDAPELLGPPTLIIPPDIDRIPAAAHDLCWQHSKSRARGRRDFDLAMKWHKREPQNPDPLVIAVSEAAARQDARGMKEACELAFRRELPAELDAYFAGHHAAASAELNRARVMREFLALHSSVTMSLMRQSNVSEPLLATHLTTWLGRL